MKDLNELNIEIELIKKDINDIKNNHLEHIETDMKDIKSMLTQLLEKS